MIPFRAHAFNRVARLFEHGSAMQHMLEFPFFGWLWARRPPERHADRFVEQEVGVLRSLRPDMQELGMVSSIDEVDRIISSFERHQLNYKRYNEMIKHLQERMEDDLSRGQFFMVPPHKLERYKEGPRLLGEDVVEAFPSTIADVENAAKCYAFGRDTAAVFHLMRVMECGLRTLAVSLDDPNLDPKRNPSWDSILKKCDDQLRLKPTDRSPAWRSDEDFFKTATGNLRAVKDAWRNPTMHVGRNYDEEESLDVIHAVRGFMRHLAGKLKE